MPWLCFDNPKHTDLSHPGVAMKVQNLFDILQDTQDLLSYFEDVANRDQMVSRLERLKRQTNFSTLLNLFACRQVRRSKTSSN